MDLTKVVEALKEQRTRIDRAIAALEGVSAAGRTRRPHMSIAARKRISEAMKQRWAKRKGKTPKKSKARPAMSDAARKKLSALMKARWAAKKKAKP
jgi:hypothetical protein